LIRFQAIGDTLVTLPIADALRKRFPTARLGMVVGERAAAAVTSTDLFDEVFSIKLSGGRRERMWESAKLSTQERGRWEVVLDLQRNRESRLLRRLLFPEAWGEFDRYSGNSCVDRSRVPVREAGLGELEIPYRVRIRPELREKSATLLRSMGWKNESLLLLNPCSSWETRQWPDERWIELARRWSGKVLLIGEAAAHARFQKISENLGEKVLNLVGKTSLSEALSLASLCNAAVSEDGALMHASWLSGIPTVAILGSSRKDWHQPLGPHSAFFSSDDLPCGNCMRPHCIRKDVLCLQRITVDQVFEKLQTVVTNG
jgi:ADP-heptose:LPS heptosyltransferase